MAGCSRGGGLASGGGGFGDGDRLVLYCRDGCVMMDPPGPAAEGDEDIYDSRGGSYSNSNG